MSERTIHRTCWEAHRLGQVARLRFIRGLLAAEETELYLKLGFSTVHQYAKDQFKCEDTQAKEFLRVARLLHKLPLMTREFEEGRLSWSAFEVMSRVAKGKEKQWLEFAKEKSMAAIKDEVHRALEENRRTPRKDGYGLRNRTVRLIFKLTLEEHDKVLKAFLKLARELSPSLKGRQLQPKEIFLFLIQRLLETDPAGTPKGRVEKEDSLYTILYHLCRNCNSAHLMTRDGPVEVPLEVIDRVKGSAEEVEISPEEEWEVVVDDAQSPVIDKPNPPSLARKVCLRDGGCCANCKRKLGLQAHHVRFRAKGGRTVLANECCLCVSCHSLLHQGLLKLTGNPIDGITFHTRADDLTEEFTKELEEKISAVPVLIINPTKEDDPEPSPQAVAAGSGDSAPGASRDQGPQAAPADIGIPVDDPKAGVSISEAGRPASDMEAGRPAEEHEAVEMTKGALRNLGFTSREARERAEGARERLLRGGRASLTVADCGDLLREAFRSRWSKKRGPE